MKKSLIGVFAGIVAVLLIFLATTHKDKEEDYLRIGMEAAYAPFNWTQKDDSNGAVKIDGTNQYANGYDVQIAKKVAEKLGKKILEWSNPCSLIWKNRYDHCRHEPHRRT